MNLVILEQMLLFLPLMIGAYLSISLMKITNLSIESAYVFGAIIAILLLQQGYQGLLGLVLALVGSAFAGSVVGIIAGTLAQKARFSHILSAIMTVGLFQGIIQITMGGSHMSVAVVNNPLQVAGTFGHHPQLLTISLVSVIIYLLYVLFMKTELGMSCAIYGNNPNFLKNYRMNQSYVVIAGLALSNALAGISGYMVAQNNGFVDMYMGMGLSLLCLSSLIIGKSMSRSSQPIDTRLPLYSVVGYFVIQTMLLHMGFDFRYFSTVQAIIIALFLLLSSRFSSGASRQNVLGV